VSPLPSGVSQIWLGGDIWRKHGVTLALYESSIRLPMELQATSVSSGAASSRWTSILLDASSKGVVQQTIDLPLSTRRYFFRCRNRATAQYSNGPWTPVVSCRPTTLQPTVYPALINAAKNVEPAGADLWLTSANKPRVGSQNTTSYVTKRLIIPHSEAVDANTSPVRLRMQAAFAQPSSKSTVNSASLVAAAVLPPGVTITQWSVTAYRQTTKDLASFSFNRITTTGGSAALGTLTASSLGWKTANSSALTEFVSTGRFYSFAGSLKGATNSTDARLGCFIVRYTMPSYDRAY
jgi:hypothetical protein